MSWDILPKGNLQYFLQKLKGKLDLKVDAVSGKGLSTNDFTTEEKNKLAGIEAGAQVNPTIDSALSDSSTNPVQNKVVKGALDNKAGREEIPSVNNNTITIQLNGTTIESFTLNQATDETINIQVTKSSVGLGNVPNVSTNDQTPSFTQASTRANIASGEKLSVIFGKIMKWFADLKAVAFSGSYNDLSDQPPIPTKVSQLTNDSGYTTNTGTVTQVKVGSAAYNPSSGVVSLPAYPTSVNYATSAGSAGSAGYASKALVEGENSGAYISVQAEGSTVIDSERDSHYYFPSCKAVTSYLNSNIAHKVLLNYICAALNTNYAVDLADSALNYDLLIMTSYQHTNNNVNASGRAGGPASIFPTFLGLNTDTNYTNVVNTFGDVFINKSTPTKATVKCNTNVAYGIIIIGVKLL